MSKEYDPFKERRVTRDQAKLAAWLAEWELDGLLADEEEDEAGPEMARPAPALYTEPVQLWEVRLLMPPPPGDSDGPLYGLVMPDSQRIDARVWVPFGRFAEPALPGEWKTEWSERPLQVLCFWLAQRRAVFASPPSWLVRRLNRAQQQQVDRAAVVDDTDQHGPLLWHPADPRQRYVAEARDRFRRYMQQSAVRLTAAEDQGPYIAEEQGSETWPLAAEGLEHYGVASMMYTTADESVRLVVQQMDGEQVRLKLMDADGLPCLDLEGGRIVADNGEASGPITCAVAIGPAALRSNAAVLVDARGNQRTLNRPAAPPD